MPAPDKTRQLAALEKIAGPSPWFWKTFPSVTGSSRQRFAWEYHGEQGDLAYLVTLGLEQEANKPRLALNTFCVPFLLPPAHLGIWCPEPGAIRVMGFDPDQLAGFQFEELVGWFKQSNDRVYAGTAPVAEFEVSTGLPAGTHPVEVPAEFRAVEELIVVGSYPAKTREDAACAVFVLYPHAGLVEVLPQKWFTARQFDVGRQWITRVTRDPDTHRLIGEGVRLGTFELSEDGCGFQRWIEKS
jgi:hypothetical protein